MIYLFILVNILSTFMTYYGHHKLKQSTIRSACLSTVILIIFLNLQNQITPITNIDVLISSTFGASFVGMSQKENFTESSLLASSLLYSIAFKFIYPLLIGLGGGLGLCAFISCSFVLIIKNIKNVKKLKSKRPKA